MKLKKINKMLGQALIESVFVIPLLITLTTMVMDASRSVYFQTTMNNIVRDVTRQAATDPRLNPNFRPADGVDETTAINQAIEEIEATLRNRLQRTIRDGENAAINICVPSINCAGNLQDDPLTVTVDSRIDFFTTAILPNSLGLNGIDLRATSSSFVETPNTAMPAQEILGLDNPDIDGDGIPNSQDPDPDGDGTCNLLDCQPDDEGRCTACSDQLDENGDPGFDGVCENCYDYDDTDPYNPDAHDPPCIDDSTSSECTEFLSCLHHDDCVSADQRCEVRGGTDPEACTSDQNCRFHNICEDDDQICTQRGVCSAEQKCRLLDKCDQYYNCLLNDDCRNDDGDDDDDYRCSVKPETCNAAQKCQVLTGELRECPCLDDNLETCTTDDRCIKVGDNCSAQRRCQLDRSTCSQEHECYEYHKKDPENAGCTSQQACDFHQDCDCENVDSCETLKKFCELHPDRCGEELLIEACEKEGYCVCQSRPTCADIGDFCEAFDGECSDAEKQEACQTYGYCPCEELASCKTLEEFCAKFPDKCTEGEHAALCAKDSKNCQCLYENGSDCRNLKERCDIHENCTQAERAELCPIDYDYCDTDGLRCVNHPDVPDACPCDKDYTTCKGGLSEWCADSRNACDQADDICAPNNLTLGGSPCKCEDPEYCGGWVDFCTHYSHIPGACNSDGACREGLKTGNVEASKPFCRQSQLCATYFGDPAVVEECDCTSEVRCDGLPRYCFLNPTACAKELLDSICDKYPQFCACFHSSNCGSVLAKCTNFIEQCTRSEKDTLCPDDASFCTTKAQLCQEHEICDCDEGVETCAGGYLEYCADDPSRCTKEVLDEVCKNDGFCACIHKSNCDDATKCREFDCNEDEQEIACSKDITQCQNNAAWLCRYHNQCDCLTRASCKSLLEFCEANGIHNCTPQESRHLCQTGQKCFCHYANGDCKDIIQKCSLHHCSPSEREEACKIEISFCDTQALKCKYFESEENCPCDVLAHCTRKGACANFGQRCKNDDEKCILNDVCTPEQHCQYKTEEKCKNKHLSCYYRGVKQNGKDCSQNDMCQAAKKFEDEDLYERYSCSTGKME